MAVKIFITGATGYIGGDALFVLYNAHPEYSYTAVVRNSEKGAPVAARFPKIRLVYGDMDSSDLIEEESANADIVLHMADSSDHVDAANAIAKGLARGHTEENPGFWLHTGGTGILTFGDSEAGRLGEPPIKEYNDLEGISELINLPDSAFHRNVDKIVLEAGEKNTNSVKTAIICPPSIYGLGRGPVITRGKQVYELTNATLRRKKAPVLGAGKTEWNNVHVYDLSNLFILLVEAAVSKNLSVALWGNNGYYFTENGSHVWGDLAQTIAEISQKKGYLSSVEVESLDEKEAMDIAGFQAVSWGLNSKGKARRARKFLGWNPMKKSLLEEIPSIVDSEARALGITVGHAKKAAGGA